MKLLSALFLFPLFLNAKPNIVFILADDLGIKDLSCEGSTFYETPHIDALTNSGMRFTNGYSTCQVCSPSRASIMTGQYPARIGITDWIGAASGTKWKRNDRVLPTEYIHDLPSKVTTVAEALKEGGYRTFFAGKWHLGGNNSKPEHHGFEVNKGGHHRGSPPGGFFSPYKNPDLEDGPRGESLPIRLAEETVKFATAKSEKPFFAFLSFYSVHGPIQTSPELWKKYQEKATKAGLVDERFQFDRTKAVRQVQDCPIYAGMMESMDDAVGLVMEGLKKAGLADNTIVIFTSDNGGVSSGDAFATSCLPLRGGKGRQWEGGIRQPFYIKAPGVAKPGSTSEVFATGTDFYPTLLELAGLEAKPEAHIDGRQKVAEADATNWAATGRVRYNNGNGLSLSGFANFQSDISSSSAEDNSALLLGASAQYQAGGFGFRALFSHWEIDGASFEAADADSQWGYFLEPSYRWSFENGSSVGVFGRYSNYEYVSGTRKETDEYTMGVNYWPIDNVVLKADYNVLKEDGAADNKTLNFGVGYSF
ncbi:sulfatase-like hydrolase/transferase [bacterium]|nr:sulfatase-like hydrolase/transferase [bacterium]